MSQDIQELIGHLQRRGPDAAINAAVEAIREQQAEIAQVREQLSDQTARADRLDEGLKVCCLHLAATQTAQDEIARLSAENANLLLSNRDCVDWYDSLNVHYKAALVEAAQLRGALQRTKDNFAEYERNIYLAADAKEAAEIAQADEIAQLKAKHDALTVELAGVRHKLREQAEAQADAAKDANRLNLLIRLVIAEEAACNADEISEGNVAEFLSAIDAHMKSPAGEPK